jgi:hypothetical protein
MFADVHEPRDPGEALAAAAVNADQVLRSLQQRVELSGELRAHDLEALRTWMELVSRLSKAVLDAGVDERRVRLAEGQGELVAEVIRGVLTDLGHDTGDPRVLRVLSTRLQSLASGGAA